MSAKNKYRFDLDRMNSMKQCKTCRRKNTTDEDSCIVCQGQAIAVQINAFDFLYFRKGPKKGKLFHESRPFYELTEIFEGTTEEAAKAAVRYAYGEDNGTGTDF